MALYVVADGRTYEYHVTVTVRDGHPCMMFDPSPELVRLVKMPGIFFVQADDDELDFLLDSFPYLREKMPVTGSVIRWYGDEARYLLTNSPNFRPVPLAE